MKMTRDNFAELLTPIHMDIIADGYKMKPKKYEQLFKVSDMPMKTVSIQEEGAFGRVATNTEGSTFNFDNITEGYTPEFTASRYDKAYTVTWELARDDLYGVFSGKGIKGGSARGLGRGQADAEEYLAASVINNGFATTTGYDGVYLFSNSHPHVDGTTGDNLVTGALSDANLKLAIENLEDQKNQADIPIQTDANLLWCAKNRKFTAYELLNSSNVAGAVTNSTNTLPDMKIVDWSYITAGYWGTMDTSYENLQFMWRDRVRVGSQDIPNTVDFLVYIYSRMTAGYSDYRGINGSLG